MTDRKTCVILSGGPRYTVDELPEGMVIACDRGYAHAQWLGVTPDLVIGDFDSYGGVIAPNVPVITLPTHKDDTDTGYALRYAVEHGYARIHILFALGDRIDHSLANIQSATKAAKQGVAVTLYGQDTRLHVLSNGAITQNVRAGQALSVLSLSDICRGVSISGAEYQLQNATLTNDYPLGVSNQAEGQVRIAVSEGVLLVSVTQA